LIFFLRIVYPVFLAKEIKGQRDIPVFNFQEKEKIIKHSDSVTRRYGSEITF